MHFLGIEEVKQEVAEGPDNVAFKYFFGICLFLSIQWLLLFSPDVFRIDC